MKAKGILSLMFSLPMIGITHSKVLHISVQTALIHQIGHTGT